MQVSPDVQAVSDEVARAGGFVDAISAELGRVIVGQRIMIERILIGLISGGHCLIEGVPGLAKTLTVSTLATIVGARFQRIQFTPDLLPADITGTTIYSPETGLFSAKRGPIFANLVLADEINRAPAKVQSALLEAMQERQVTIGDETFRLPEPFLVMATQNPIEQEGTYPLPEAQLDRFMLMIKVSYPSRAEERQMMDRMSAPAPAAPATPANMSPAASAPAMVGQVSSLAEILAARAVVGRIYIDDKIRDYIIELVRATREPHAHGLAELGPLIELGASPRASIYLATAGRAHAFLRRRGYVTPDDIKAVAADVLRHRVMVSYEAEAEDISSDDLIRRLLMHIEVP